MNQNSGSFSKLLRRYLKKHYTLSVEIVDCEYKNKVFDVLLWDRSVALKIELKSRYFVHRHYLEQDDILIELVQNVPYFSERGIPTLKNVNTSYSPYDVNTAIGWYYKCNADRLFYLRYLDDLFVDLVDIDFKMFKPWLDNQMEQFCLHYSKKSTGTINLVVPIRDIPSPFINWVDRKLEVKDV